MFVNYLLLPRIKLRTLDHYLIYIKKINIDYFIHEKTEGQVKVNSHIQVSTATM